MSKEIKTVINLFTEGLKLYFSNFTNFMKYMTFPVLGQILGLIIIFLTVYFYSKNMPLLINKYPDLDNFNYLITLSILITLPGLAIFTKAFWEYLVAYGAINSMFANMQKSGKVYDFDAHTELIKRRTIPFVGLWFLFGVFSIIAFCPLFTVICGIFTIYFVLIFQVFTFEPELSPIGCAKKSFNLIKGHFLPTFALFALAGLITYLLIPNIFVKIFELSSVTNWLSNLCIPFVSEIQLPDIAQFGLKSPSAKDIANFLVEIIIAQVVIQYTLPIRSILYSLWYKELNKKNLHFEKTKKRPSEKLMEESHKKYGTKNLDKNILKRAYEKDND